MNFLNDVDVHCTEMADAMVSHSDRVVDTAGHNDMTSQRESAMTDDDQGRHDQGGETAAGSDTQQQPQEAGDGNERRRRTAVFVHGPVLTVRDRVFHALFYRLALIYAHAIPHQLRRVVEFALLFEVMHVWHHIECC